MKKLRTIFSISRPISWVNTAAPFVAGYILSVGKVDALFVVGAVFFLIPYNILMYGINDIFDYESDKNNPRKNSVEGAVATPAIHRSIWWACAVSVLPFVAYLLLQGGLAAKLWLTVLLFDVVAYSMKGLRFKEIPLLDSFSSSTHFYGPLLYGLLLGGALSGYWYAIAAFVGWGMASHAFGAIQDIQFDREAGIHSVATAFGARATAWLCFGLYAGAVLLVRVGFAGTIGNVLVLCALLLYLLMAGFCLRITDANAGETNRYWKQFLWVNQVVGFCITMNYLAPRAWDGAYQSVVYAASFIVVGAAALYLVSRKSIEVSK